MQDDTDADAATDARGKGGRRSGGASEEAGGSRQVEGQIARMLVRAQWVHEWTAANPGASQSDRRAAWKDVRAARIEQHLKAARRILTVLQRQGVSMTLSAAAADADGEDDGAEA